MGEIKSIGFNWGKCTFNSSSDLSETEDISGIWYDSNEWIKGADYRPTPFDNSSKILGVKSTKSNWDGTDLKGSKAGISSGYSGREKDEEASSLLLKEDSLTSLSGLDNGETICKLEWDLVCI